MLLYHGSDLELLWREAYQSRSLLVDILLAFSFVGGVSGDKVYVQFDGWRGAFDYYCRYDSREIFPVGWCEATGNVLQPPGTKGNAIVI